MPLPGKANVGRSELQFADWPTKPPIENNIGQNIAFLMAWDSGNEIWRMLNVDNDGQLKLSPQSQQTNIVNPTYVTTVGVPALILPSNPNRVAFEITNSGINNAIWGMDNTITDVLGMSIPPATVYFNNVYNGPVWIRSGAGVTTLFVVEYT